MKLPKYSIGTGDRFGLQGEAQLSAVIEANSRGIPIHPVWNKSKREHDTANTHPSSVREEADRAVAALGWKNPYFVDADHINMKSLPDFLDSSDFFTIDVAEQIGKKADSDSREDFIRKCRMYMKDLPIPGTATVVEGNSELINRIADTYLEAVKEAGRVYRTIKESRGEGNFITEVSMDETENPQKPGELFFILKALAEEGVPVDTIAPKFVGRFNKGVDYVGNVERFKKDFHDHLAVIDYARREFGLPENCKISVHTGSDKFSLYPLIREEIKIFKSGIHIKTAGTTWLEEIAGLAEAGEGGLVIAKDIYARAYGKFEELHAPYASVIDVDKKSLPTPDELESWGNIELAEAIRHNQESPRYNPQLRQFFHISYKMAAAGWEVFQSMVKEHGELIGERVKENILEKHILPAFPAE